MKNLFQRNTAPKPGKIFVLSGPGGVGKKTIEIELLRSVPNLWKPVSVTTRKPRPGEVPGVDYHFVSKAEFRAKFRNNEFIEYTRSREAWFGSLRQPVIEKINQGVNVLFELDVHGGIAIKKEADKAVLIFLVPPDKESLKRRMLERGIDDEVGIELRLREADAEIEIGVRNYEHVIENKVIEETVAQIEEIIKKTTNQSN